MDKGHRYISMCAAAAPLQDHWQKARGDVYTMDMETVHCWLPERPAVDETRNGYGIVHGHRVVRIRRMVWLPRLDQLMMLAQLPGASFDRTAQAFFTWCGRDQAALGIPKERFGSLEQMWLAFVMLTRYHRQWLDDGQWQEIGGTPTGSGG